MWGQIYHFYGSIITIVWPLYTLSNPPKNLAMGQIPPPFWQCQDFDSACSVNPSLTFIKPADSFKQFMASQSPPNLLVIFNLSLVSRLPQRCRGKNLILQVPTHSLPPAILICLSAGQMFLLDRFFDGTFLTFGIEVLSIHPITPLHVSFHKHQLVQFVLGKGSFLE